jgi:hypothetical protein
MISGARMSSGVRIIASGPPSLVREARTSSRNHERILSAARGDRADLTREVAAQRIAGDAEALAEEKARCYAGISLPLPPQH